MEIRTPGQQPGHPAYTPPEQPSNQQRPDTYHVVEESIYYDGNEYVEETREYDVPAGPVDEQGDPIPCINQNVQSNASIPPIPPQQPPTSEYGYAPQPAPQPQYCQVPVAEPSAFSKAWNDIKNTPDAVSSFGFKGLVNCVPILNFTVWGMGGKWARDAADGRIEPMPKKVVDQDNFTVGFFYFLIALILGFVLGIVNVVPIIGQIVFFAACFFVPTVSLVMFQRYIAFGSFGEAFAVKDIWEKMTKRNFGELWVATFVPTLITGLIAGVFSFIVMMIFGGVGTFGTLFSAASGSVGGALAGLGAIGIGSVLCFLITMILSVVGTLWGMRGCGYWIQKNVPEWNSINAQQARAARIAAEQARAQQQYQQAQAQAQYAQQQAYYQQPQNATQQPTTPPVPQQPAHPAVQQQEAPAHDNQGYYPPQQ